MIIEGWFVLFCLVIGPLLCVVAILVGSIFKRKYKRSQWMEGLLECEQMIKSGYRIDNLSFAHQWFVLDDSHIGIPLDNQERIQGVVDYIYHYENNLK